MLLRETSSVVVPLAHHGPCNIMVLRALKHGHEKANLNYHSKINTVAQAFILFGKDCWTFKNPDDDDRSGKIVIS